MVTYHATEKDCMDEGGEPAECVICFEEFEQGIEMGRLECLCKFHKVCVFLGIDFCCSPLMRTSLLMQVWGSFRLAYGNGGIQKGWARAQCIRVVLHEFVGKGSKVGIIYGSLS